jgi:nucleoside-diphosphate-sugar epimerase
LAGISFDPATIGASIKKLMPEFDLYFASDFREEIAASWPESIDDSAAQADWNWTPKYDLDTMTAAMLSNLKAKLQRS